MAKRYGVLKITRVNYMKYQEKKHVFTLRLQVFDDFMNQGIHRRFPAEDNATVDIYVIVRCAVVYYIQERF